MSAATPRASDLPAGPGAAGPSTGWRLAGPVSAGAAILGAALAGLPAGALRFPGLWDLGRVLAAVAAAGVLVAWRLPPGPSRPVRAGALGAAWLALMALLGRGAQWHHAVFEAVHPHFAGVPASLAFASLGAAALALGPRPRGLRARQVLVAALLWTTAVLLWPVYVVDTGHLPLAVAVHLLVAGGPGGAGPLAGAVLLLLALPVGAGWVAAVRAAWGGGGEGGVPSPPTLAALGVGLLVAWHLIAPLVAPDGAGGGLRGAIGAGLLVAALLALVALEGARLLAGLDGDPLEPTAARRLSRAVDLVVPAGVLVLYGLLKTHGMGASATDENIYFYMASRLVHGTWPYVDYFFAHPPLHVLLPGILFAAFGYHFLLAKAVSVVAGGVTGLVVWTLARRHLGLVAALVAMVACLFATQMLKATTDMTGVNLTVMWLMLGILQALEGRGGAAGVLFGVAACTGVYAIAAVCAMLAVGAFRDRRFALRQLAGFAAVFAGVNLVFLAWAGAPYLDAVYRYHGLKAMQDPRMLPIFGSGHGPLFALGHDLVRMVQDPPFTREIFYEAHLWLAGILAPVVALAAFALDPDRRGRLRRFLDPRRFWMEATGPARADARVAIPWLAALALFVEFAMFHRIYSFYFALFDPLLALVLGYVLARGLGLAASALTWAWPGRQGVLRLAAGTAAIALLSLWAPWSASASRVFHGERAHLGERVTYTWRPAPVLPVLSGIVHALFWQGSRRRGGMDPGYCYYLWTKKRRFVTAPAIARYVRTHSRPGETLAGASDVAPLIALEAHRRLAAGIVDTNGMRFETGLLREATYWNAICHDAVRFVITYPGSYFTDGRMETLPVARRWFRRVKVFRDPQLHFGGTWPIGLYERVGRPPPTSAGSRVVCRVPGAGGSG